MKRWIAGGITGVDTGQILITDPAYVVRDPDQQEYEPFRSYEAFMANTDDSLPSHQITNEFGAEVGVHVTNFGGDGVYPVYIQVDEYGRVLAAQIRFDGGRP